MQYYTHSCIHIKKKTKIKLKIKKIKGKPKKLKEN